MALSDHFLQSGTSHWILDSGAYFPTISNSSSLSSLHPLASLNVVTANGTSFSVTGRGTLYSSFNVPSVAHVRQLTMQLGMAMCIFYPHARE